MKEKLTKLLEAKQEQKRNLDAALIESDSKEERAAIGETLKALATEIADVEAMLAEVDEPAAQENKDTEKGDERKMNVLETMQTRALRANDLEYRKAFRDYIANGDVKALRAAAGNATSDTNGGTVIPENLLNQIVERLETDGTIYNLVTKTAYPVGQTIPKEATKPIATWVGRKASALSSSTSGEGEGSTVGKGTTLDTAISFTHFKLRCEVAMTEEVAQMSLSAFEALFVKNVSLAMLRAIEGAIVDGDGYGQPTGILANTAPTGQAVEVAASGKLTYKVLCNAEAALPPEYESGAKWCMTKKTFMEIVGMTDNNGQPIARVNYGINGKPERTILGRDVILYQPQSGSKLGNYSDTVTNDTLFAFIFNFEDYILNNNYDLGIQHKIDWDNEDHRTKAVAAYDGKVVDKNSLVTLTKKKA